MKNMLLAVLLLTGTLFIYQSRVNADTMTGLKVNTTTLSPTHTSTMIQSTVTDTAPMITSETLLNEEASTSWLFTGTNSNDIPSKLVTTSANDNTSNTQYSNYRTTSSISDSYETFNISHTDHTTLKPVIAVPTTILTAVSAVNSDHTAGTIAESERTPTTASSVSSVTVETQELIVTTSISTLYYTGPVDTTFSSFISLDLNLESTEILTALLSTQIVTSSIKTETGTPLPSSNIAATPTITTSELLSIFASFSSTSTERLTSPTTERSPTSIFHTDVTLWEVHPTYISMATGSTSTSTVTDILSTTTKSSPTTTTFNSFSSYTSIEAITTSSNILTSAKSTTIGSSTPPTQNDISSTTTRLETITSTETISTSPTKSHLTSATNSTNIASTANSTNIKSSTTSLNITSSTTSTSITSSTTLTSITSSTTSTSITSSTTSTNKTTSTTSSNFTTPAISTNILSSTTSTNLPSTKSSVNIISSTTSTILNCPTISTDITSSTASTDVASPTMSLNIMFPTIQTNMTSPTISANSTPATISTKILHPTTSSNITTSTTYGTNGTFFTTTNRPSIDYTTELGSSIVSLDKLEIRVTTTMTVQKVFEAALENKSSELFKTYSIEFKDKLNKKYENISNFRSVQIEGFSDGSIKCKFSLLFNGDVDFKDIVNAVNKSSPQLILTLGGQSVNATVEIAPIQEKLKGGQPTCDMLNVNPCLKGSECSISSDQVVCRHPCTRRSDYCQNNGACLYDHTKDKITCRCMSSDAYVFSGEKCEVRVEKLQLESKFIAAIAASVGGVIVIAAVVAIVYLVYRMSRKEAKDADEREEDISLDNLRKSTRTRSENSYEKFRGRHPSNETTSNDSIGDIERSKSEVTRVLDGVEHKVMRDEKGNEVFIYQPKQPRDLGRQRLSSVYSYVSEDNATHVGSSAYDYIDTETKYQIRRPNISIRTIRI